MLHDAQMGGSIYVVGENMLKPQSNTYVEGLIGTPKYSFMCRMFTCVSENKEPVLFMDALESGNPAFNSLNHWRGYDENERFIINPNRINEVYYAVAAAMYVADALDINTVVPRDFELVELSRNLGLTEKRIFSRDQDFLKIGLHSKKKNSGVYTHSLYRKEGKNFDGHQLRFSTLPRFAYDTAGKMIDELEKLSSVIISSNDGRRKMVSRTLERFDAVLALNNLVQEFALTTDNRKAYAAEIVSRTSEVVKRYIPDNKL